MHACSVSAIDFQKIQLSINSWHESSYCDFVRDQIVL